MEATVEKCPQCGGDGVRLTTFGGLDFEATCVTCCGTGFIDAEESNENGSRGYEKEFDGAYADDDVNE